MLKRLGRTNGQTTAEYVLVFAIIALALVLFTYVGVYPRFLEGAGELNQEMERQTSRGYAGNPSGCEDGGNEEACRR